VPPMLVPWALRLIGHIVVGADVRKLNGMYMDDDLCGGGFWWEYARVHPCFLPWSGDQKVLLQHGWRGALVSMSLGPSEQDSRTT
jgi:hypothetical protein